MIVGTGIDIVEIQRIEKSIEKSNKLFLDYFLTPEEQAQLPQNGGVRLQRIAGRWAGKEAVAKALGTGFGKSCAWLDICILNNALGAPVVQLSGTAQMTALARGVKTFHLSISHEHNYACAMAIAEG